MPIPTRRKPADVSGIRIKTLPGIELKPDNEGNIAIVHVAYDDSGETREQCYTLRVLPYGATLIRSTKNSG